MYCILCTLDVLDGMKAMFTRTQFAVDQGGYFPEIKVRYSIKGYCQKIG